MSKVVHPAGVLAVALLVLVADWRPAYAQRLKLGGSKQQDSSQASHNDDGDDDADADRHGDQWRKGSTNRELRFQQTLIPGGQSNQSQDGTIQQKKFIGQQFQNQSNAKQFQNWQQGNQQSLKIGGWNAGKWQGSHSIQKWTQALGGQQQPFTTQWYKDHPKAWKYDNNKANVWITATLPGVYGWLGWGSVPPQYQGQWGNAPQFDPSYYGDWYPLGVFSLMSGPGDPGTRIVQLVVDRQGRIAGNYYDMITNSNYSLSGNIRQQSQRASWWLNKNQFVRFRAPLYNLLQPYGSVTVELPGGEQYWQFVRLEN